MPTLTLPPPTRPTGGQLRALLISGAAYAGLAYATPRPAFGLLLLLFAVAFGAYAWLLRRPLPLRTGLLAALLLRLLWLPALPALSDDYHRFRWDGALVAQGQSPYLYRPDSIVRSQGQVAGGLGAMAGPQTQVAGSQNQPHPATNQPATDNREQEANNRQQLTEYARLNSPHYYSVYPPLCQAVFGLAARLFPASERGAVLVMRLVLLAAEAGTAWLLLALLPQFGLPKNRAQWYLLNPLVVVELTGNLHFEALAICLLLAALWLLMRGWLAWSALALAGAAATKLLPLLLLPLLLRRLAWRQFLPYAVLTGVLFAVCFAPFLSAALLHNISRSLELYFHSFEFNASIYYVLRAIGYWKTGYNEIARLGPGLALAAAVAILLLAIRGQNRSLTALPRALLLALTAYYLLATVVHPWYLTPLIALSIFTRYQYMLVWSGLVVLSYAAYQTSAYTENLWLVGVEYAGVLTALNLDVLGSYMNDFTPDPSD